MDTNDAAVLDTKVKEGREKRMTKERSNKSDKEGIREMKETQIKTYRGKIM